MSAHSIVELSGALTARAEGQQPVSWELPLVWVDGRPFSEREQLGFVRALCSVKGPDDTELLQRLRPELSGDAASAIAGEALRLQPISGRAQEVWSLYAVAIFGDASSLESLRGSPVALVEGKPRLGEHLVASLGLRGDGFAARALCELTAARGKTGLRARRALEEWVLRSLTPSRTEVDVLHELAFPEDERSPGGRAVLGRWLEWAMVSGKAFTGADVRTLLRPRSLRACCRGVVFHQNGACGLVTDAGPETLEGRPFDIGDEGDVVLPMVNLRRAPMGFDEAQRSRAAARIGELGLQPVLQQLSPYSRARTMAALNTRAGAGAAAGLWLMMRGGLVAQRDDGAE